MRVGLGRGRSWAGRLVAPRLYTARGWLKITEPFAQRTRIPLASVMMVSFLIHQRLWSVNCLRRIVRVL